MEIMDGGRSAAAVIKQADLTAHARGHLLIEQLSRLSRPDVLCVGRAFPLPGAHLQRGATDRGVSKRFLQE